jgi:Plant transposon protein
MLVVDFRGW